MTNPRNILNRVGDSRYSFLKPFFTASLLKLSIEDYHYDHHFPKGVPPYHVAYSLEVNDIIVGFLYDLSNYEYCVYRASCRIDGY